MQLTTTQCGRFGHREFLLEADEAHVPDVYFKNVIQMIEGMVSQGSVFEPGQKLQIGWMFTQVQTRDAAHLTLYEPDMKSFPIEWVPGITHTVRQMMLQLFMLDSVSLRKEMNPATIVQTLIVCDRYSEPDFFMNRDQPTNDRDSGWFIGCLDERHDHNARENLRRVSAYEAFLHQQGIQGFLSFPVGSMIVMDQTAGMSIFKDGNKLEIQPGSFLDAWFKKQRG